VKDAVLILDADPLQKVLGRLVVGEGEVGYLVDPVD